MKKFIVIIAVIYGIFKLSSFSKFISSNLLIRGYCDRRYSDLKYSMDELFNDGTFADVTIVADDHEFRAHKAILSSRSKVFHDMLSTKAVRNSNRIVINDLSEDTVEKCFDLCTPDRFYLGKLFQRLFPELLHAAHSYKLTLPTRNMFQDSGNYSARGQCNQHASVRRKVFDTNLEKESVEFITKNMLFIQDQDKWLEFMRTHPKLANGIVESLAKRRRQNSSEELIQFNPVQ
ncbi:TD and POZ domain-containing protein 1 [Caerostris extrusa]|uniref:TD and POZ domain-containing protein 1 n=1 Tax=Caerostris extrusa TaxID=172846 RepID=A0AAV4SNB2_CAEEX|nr:TD and POZ domain-containing protein 1 [Caerostris extrusa]